jgi:curved DNA-binding protein CbpA
MDSSQAKDYYAVLGVSRDASSQEVKKRFLELARTRHPDRYQGEEKSRAELEFQDFTEAFNVLMDPLRRRQIDLALTRPASANLNEASDVVRVFMNRGIRAYKEGRWLEAASNFDRATQVDHKNSQAWHHLALVGTKEERWLGKAQEAIERALGLAPNDVAYLKLAGKIFAMSKMTDRAKQYYNHALKVGGPDSTVKKALEELGGAPLEPSITPRNEPEKGKPSLFRKIW